MLKRILYLIIISIMLFNSLFPIQILSFAAETVDALSDTEAYVRFDNGIKSKNIVEVFMDNEDDLAITQFSGREVYKIAAGIASSAFLYIDLAEEMGNSAQDGSEYEVNIEYFNYDKGFFVVWYDSIDYGKQMAETVYVSNTQEWKNVVFTLKDAKFAKGVDQKGDLMISLRETGTSLANSSSDIIISSLTITRKKAKNPILVSSDTDAAGNTFEYFKKEKTVHNKFTNTSNKNIDAKITYTMVSNSNYVKFSKTENISLKPREVKVLDINIDCDYCDLYEWHVNIEDINGEWKSEFNDIQLAIVKTDPDGIRGTFAHTMGGYKDNLTDVFQMVNKANIGSVRITLLWSDVERGGEDFFADHKLSFRNIEMADKLGLDVLVQLGFGSYVYDNSWNVLPVSERALEGWRKYCEFVVSRTKDFVSNYEVWNEPDLTGINTRNAGPADLAKITQIARETVNKYNPGATVLGMSITGLTNEHRYNYWMKEALDAGIADKETGMNALSLHTYTPNEEPESAKMFDVVKKYRDYVGEYGLENIPITITEFGNTIADSRTTRQNQSDWITRTAVLFKAHDVGENQYQYNMARSGIFNNDREDSFGMVSTAYDKYNQRGKVCIPTSTYLAYAGLNYVLGGEIENDGLFDIDGNITMCRFKSEKFKKNVLAMWGAYNDTYVTLDLGVSSVDLYDSYGNKSVVYGNKGVFTFLLDQNISYIVGNFTKNDVLESDSFISCDTTEINGVENDLYTLNFKNHTDNEYVLDFELYDSAKLVENNGFDENGDAVAVINLGGNEGMTNYINTVVSDKSGKTIWKSKIRVNVLSVAQLDIRFVPKDSENYNHWSGMAEIKNNSSTKSISGGRIRFIYPEVFAELDDIKFGEIKPNETLHIEFNSPEIKKKTIYPLKYEFLIDNENTETISESMDFTVAAYTAMSPEIDGVMTEGEWLNSIAMSSDEAEKYIVPTVYMPFVWTGPDDLSAEISLMWDEENLYLFSKVKDDIHNQEFEPSGSWEGDSLQFALYVDKHQEDFVAAGQGGTNFSEFCLAATPDGSSATTYRFKSQDELVPKGLCETAKTKVVRKGDTTYYEWTMPWKDIVGIDDWKPIVGEKLGFSVLWNDNDGDGREGWMEYASGIGRAKDSSLFTYLNIFR